MNDQLGEAVIEGIRRLQDKVDGNHQVVQEQIKDIHVVMTENTESLKLHMYRTELAEKRLEHIEADIKPLKAYLSIAKAGFAVVGMLATGIGLVAAIMDILGYFKH